MTGQGNNNDLSQWETHQAGFLPAVSRLCGFSKFNGSLVCLGRKMARRLKTIKLKNKSIFK